MSERAGRLLEVLERLPEEQGRALLEYAEYLLARHGARPAPDPLDVPRPAEETVVRAIQRLRATYPMLDPARLLGEATELMTQHVVQGRDRIEVIDELEVLFRTHYRRLTGDEE
jgi:hypothetical protein